MLQCVGQVLYKRWARLMGEEHWLTDPRFRTDELRAEHGEILSDRTAPLGRERTTRRPSSSWRQHGSRGAVLSPQQGSRIRMFAPGVSCRDGVPGLDRPATLVSGSGVERPRRRRIRTRAPTIGEHTDSILEELGFAADEIADFAGARSYRPAMNLDFSEDQKALQMNCGVSSRTTRGSSLHAPPSSPAQRSTEPCGSGSVSSAGLERRSRGSTEGRSSGSNALPGCR